MQGGFGQKKKPSLRMLNLWHIKAKSIMVDILNILPMLKIQVIFKKICLFWKLSYQKIKCKPKESIQGISCSRRKRGRWKSRRNITAMWWCLLRTRRRNQSRIGRTCTKNRTLISHFCYRMKQRFLLMFS